MNWTIIIYVVAILYILSGFLGFFITIRRFRKNKKKIKIKIKI